MKKLPIQLRRIIRKKRFSLNTLNPENIAGWRRGLDIKWRITNVTTVNERWYEEQSPLNDRGNKILVNIKVSGNVESNENLKEISEVARYTRVGGDGDGWGSYYNSNYYSGWGYESHKKIRQEIRGKIGNDLKDYLKLLGISPKHHWNGIEVKTITWEK